MSTVPVLVDAAAREEAAVLAAISASGHDSWSADQFLSSMENPVARVFSAHCKDDSRSAGTAGYAVIYYDSDGSELVQIAVDPCRRRRGVGTALMEKVFSFLNDSHVPRIVLEVRAHNDEAIAFYTRLGFRRLTIQKDFYRNPADDAVRMIRKL